MNKLISSCSAVLKPEQSRFKNLRSLERTERMMVRWMFGVSLKGKKHSADF